MEMQFRNIIVEQSKNNTIAILHIQNFFFALN